MAGAPASHFRAVRLMHRVLLCAAFAYFFVAERLAKTLRPVPPAISVSFLILAGLVVTVAYGYRAWMLRAATESLERNPKDAQALARWRQAHILVMVLLFSVSLFGFSLRFLGASLTAVLPFYFVSILLLFLWGPRELPRPMDAVSGSAEDHLERRL